MPRDYAKNSSHEKKRGQLPGWVWMMGGLTIGLFVAFVVYLNNNTRRDGEQDSIATVIQETFSDLQENAQDREERLREGKPEQTREQQTSSSETKPTASKEDDKPKTSFDFYYILPELEVAVPERELATKTKEAKTKPPQQQESIDYIIQAGAFRQHGQADNLKAKLALHGIIAYIQTVDNKSDTWHRVRIGPISNMAKLNKMRKRLKDNGIANIVVKPKA